MVKLQNTISKFYIKASKIKIFASFLFKKSMYYLIISTSLIKKFLNRKCILGNLEWEIIWEIIFRKF